MLWQENIEGVDAFLALTDNDDSNAIAGLIARRLGAAKVVAQVNRLNDLGMVGGLGINTAVSPRLKVVDAILEFVRKGDVLSVRSLGEEAAEAIEIQAPASSKYIGRPLRDIRLPPDAIVAAFESPLIESIVMLFMLLSGISFIQHYRMWVEGRPLAFFTDFEARYYLMMVGAASLVITAVLVWESHYAPAHALRSALFEVSAIITTTGFVTDDYAPWPPLPQMILLGLMFVGGCTGSTAGGLKTARIVLLARVVDREFRRMAEPQGVFKVRLGSVIPEVTIQSLRNLVYLAFLVNFIAALLLAALGVDVLTAIGRWRPPCSTWDRGWAAWGRWRTTAICRRWPNGCSAAAWWRGGWSITACW